MFRHMTQSFIRKALEKTRKYLAEDGATITKDIKDLAEFTTPIGGAVGAAGGLIKTVSREDNRTIPGKIAQGMEDVVVGAVGGTAAAIVATAGLRTAVVTVPLTYGLFKLYDWKKTQMNEIEELRSKNIELENTIHKFKMKP